MPARFRILPSEAPAPGTAERATGPLHARDVEIADGLDEIRVGRRPDVELPLPFPSLSAVHARLRREGSDWTIEDAGSTNGTWVGAERLAPHTRRPLARGAELRLGAVRVRFEGEVPPGPGVEGTGTIARRLVDNLFGLAASAPAVRVVRGTSPTRLVLGDLGRPYIVGRSEGCALPLLVAEVSREHAVFERGADGVTLRDLDSKNGIAVAEVRIAGRRRLKDGDVIQIGPVTLAFEDPVDRYLNELRPPAAAAAAPTAPAAPAAPPPAAAAPTADLPPLVAAAMRRSTTVAVPILGPAAPAAPASAPAASAARPAAAPPASSAAAPPASSAAPAVREVEAMFTEEPSLTAQRPPSTTPRLATFVGVVALVALIAVAVALTFF